MLKKKLSWFLLLIVIFGSLIRFYRISANSLYGDELTMVYDTYSILKTGKDQTGEVLPITFRMGAGRQGGYIYFSLPFVALFGPTAQGERALSVLSGLGIIILIFLLTKRLFNEKIGLIASLLTAISPWDVSLSRGGFEAHFALFLALLGTYLFIIARQKPAWLIGWAVSWGISFLTYPTFKLTLPIFFVFLFWYTRVKDWILKESTKRYAILGSFVIIIFSIVTLVQGLYSNSEERFLNINIFSQEDLKQGIIQKVNEERNLTNLPKDVIPIFHNKPFEYSKLLLGSYLANFSPDFLFIKGDGNPRHNTAEMGELYLAEIFLMAIGIFALAKNYRREFTLFIFWLAIAPFATTFLLTPHALRNSFMLPPLILFSSFGIYTLISQKNKIWILLVGALIITQFIFMLERIYFLAPVKFARFWSYPAKNAAEKAITNRNSYDYIFLSSKIDNIEYAYPVYARINPQDVADQFGKETLLNNNRLIKKFTNVYIGFIPYDQRLELTKAFKEKTLFID